MTLRWREHWSGPEAPDRYWGGTSLPAPVPAGTIDEEEDEDET